MSAIEERLDQLIDESRLVYLMRSPKAVAKHQERRDALRASIAADYRELLEFVEQIAGQSCCETEGCSIEEPYCDPMSARAILARVKGEGP